ncbi:DUF1819 family protein [Clostridium sp. CS001]|uniref:DUF1819 family protein n=1 Tax=Clostridium sp. CS001 TaxID=2880648 RepID=UPI001CF4F633|nr:DUF1819 family protein [Clostridium sp. CS001]MCB2290856.1 DUF1819 family protein [Clostridium sp. CS001]
MPVVNSQISVLYDRIEGPKVKKRYNIFGQGCEYIMIKKLEYTSTLTSASFSYYELKQVLKLKVEGLSDKEIKDKVNEENIFQYKSKSSSNKIMSAIIVRVKVLDEYLIKTIISEPMEIGKIVNLYIIMKTNRLFFEFMNEVIRERLEFNNDILEKKDINIFFIAKAEQSETVAQWSEVTNRKLKQVILKILTEVGILENIKTGKLSRLIIPPELKDYLINIGDRGYIEAMGEYIR